MDNITAKYFLFTLSSQVTRKLVAYYNQELAPLGLTAQQLIALGVLCFEEDLSLGEFAERVKVRKATAVSMIRRLKSMGLVTSEPHPKDARLNVLKITDKTRETIPKIHEKVAELEDNIEAQIGVSNLKRLVDDLSLLLDAEI
ncbi:MAG: MarR family transcriptional regulator [Desulfobacterales bacterium]|nr:MarR family transcriptional regulator [Desulfobacterales bacterium]